MIINQATHLDKLINDINNAGDEWGEMIENIIRKNTKLLRYVMFLCLLSTILTISLYICFTKQVKTVNMYYFSMTTMIINIIILILEIILIYILYLRYKGVDINIESYKVFIIVLFLILQIFCIVGSVLLFLHS